jgi:uncharacterized DUF497 family protein
MRFEFDKNKSEELKKNPRRGIGFEEAQRIWTQAYYLDRRSEQPEQWRAIGWVAGTLYTVIYEERNDEQGDYLHLVTLWRSTKEERGIYEKYS